MSAAYRADHVGSFLRPPQLQEAMAGHAEQRVSDDALREVADAAILRVLELQRAAGVDVYSDGEYRRSWFAGAWQKAVAGLVAATGEPPRYLGWKGPNHDAAREMTASVAERAGGFESLRFVPADKVVVLGLVSSKTPQLESQDDLLRRIEEASRYVPVERLALSPQCGFASTIKGNLLGWDDQRRKLELVVDTAPEVWG